MTVVTTFLLFSPDFCKKMTVVTTKSGKKWSQAKKYCRFQPEMAILLVTSERF